MEPAHTPSVNQESTSNMSTTQQKVGRRELHYSNLEDVIVDAENLAAGPVLTSGDWTFGQILEHLAVTFDYSIDGFPFRGPWFLRKIVAPFLKNRFLTKPMPSGFKLPKNAGALKPGEVSVEEGLAHLKRAIGRFETETPNADHPVFGKMAQQEWVSLGLRHCELHLSFVSPAESQD